MDSRNCNREPTGDCTTALDKNTMTSGDNSIAAGRSMVSDGKNSH
ncbi:hypothetical protein VQL36_19660 [Chengkuizengella sp. SCS-71B]